MSGSGSRGVATWITATLLGLSTGYATLVVMLAREGIGPGDELSVVGRVLPLAVGAGVFALVVWRRGPRGRP